MANDPILFVHGWNSSSSTWDTMIERFAADGWASAELNNWSYNYNQSNATTAQEIATKVDQILSATGAAKVDIVTHSMGGLSSRYYTKNLGGDAKVDEWVSLGGPNHGTDTANFCFSTSCYEMRIGSSFLSALNSGDETPGAPSYGTWWSPCDTIINPDSQRVAERREEHQDRVHQPQRAARGRDGLRAGPRLRAVVVLAVGLVRAACGSIHTPPAARGGGLS